MSPAVATSMLCDDSAATKSTGPESGPESVGGHNNNPPSVSVWMDDDEDDFSKYAYSLNAPESVGGRLVGNQVILNPPQQQGDEDTLDDFSKYQYSLPQPDESVGGRLVGGGPRHSTSGAGASISSSRYNQKHNRYYYSNPPQKLQMDPFLLLDHSIHVDHRNNNDPSQMSAGEDLTDFSYDVILVHEDGHRTRLLGRPVTTTRASKIGSLAVGTIAENRIVVVDEKEDKVEVVVAAMPSELEGPTPSINIDDHDEDPVVLAPAPRQSSRSFARSYPVSSSRSSWNNKKKNPPEKRSLWEWMQLLLCNRKAKEEQDSAWA